MNPLRAILLSKRGLRSLLLHAFAAFGLLGGAIQLVTSVYVPDKNLPHPLLILLGVIGVSLLYAFFQTWPSRTVTREFTQPAVTITVKEGDLFDESGHLVIGFTDTFDTDTSDSRIINATSIQGQLLQRRFDNDLHKLDEELDNALQRYAAGATLRRQDKPLGKLKRYPIGTTAVLGTGNHQLFCLAYSVMGSNLVAQSNIDRLWQSLGSLWDAVFESGQRGAIAMPIVGSELARINCVDRESLLRMVLLSFMARSREMLISKELTVVIHPKDRNHINMLEIEAFLKAL